MDTPRIQIKLNELQKTVDEYNVKKKNTFSLKKYMKPIYAYIGIPVICIILLGYFKPSFLYKEQTDKHNIIRKTFLYKKLILFGMVIGIMLNIGLYVYLQRKN
tara:strand:- start:540 stop:848 length:309 start_codon:yes stop_codon:yes gene_type:complete